MALNKGLPAQFPVFVTLGARHQSLIHESVRPDYLYSDFNFISLWSWDHQDRLQFCFLNGNLVVRFQNYQASDDHFFSFFGRHRVTETALELLEYSRQSGKMELSLIPEFVVENIRAHPQLTIREDRDNHDYIIAVRSMIELEGEHNQGNRYSLRKFLRDNEDHLEVLDLNIGDTESRQEIRNVVRMWADQVADRPSFNENEIRAIEKLLDNWDAISTQDLHIVGIRLNGVLKAFSIAEILENEYAMWHYKKADRDVKGLGVALDHFSARRLAERGVTYLNHEQDLGIMGLRRAKMALNPVRLLRKYSISVA